MPICSECGNEFSRDGLGRRRAAQCSEECREAAHKKQVMAAQARRMEYIRSLKTECSRCGYSEFKAGLALHHVDPTRKAAPFSSMGKDRIKQEADKCVVLCNNCHQALHAGELVLEFEKIEFGWRVKQA